MGQSGSASEPSNIMIVPLLLLGLAASSPVDRPARQTSMVLVRAGEGQRIESRQSSVEDIRVPAGEAVDIFYRYGFFSLSVRVVPRDDHGSWLIREPTTKVFTPNSLRQVKELRAGKFEPQFQIFFCDELEFLTDGTQAITALSFRSIGALLPSVQAQDYYNEIVNTQLALWEVNI